jgi:hypothetical protein
MMLQGAQPLQKHSNEVALKEAGWTYPNPLHDKSQAIGYIRESTPEKTFSLLKLSLDTF